MTLRLYSFILAGVVGMHAASSLVAQEGIADDQEEVVETKEKKEDPNKTKIVVNFDEEDEGEAEEEHSSGVGRLFENPALASGLSSGSALINRSLESLMEVIFYRLLDQQLSIPIDENSGFVFETNRTLFPTPTGAFVVVDRFGLGPEHSREIRKFDKVTVSLGAKGRVNVFDIYLRTDGMRLAEQEDLPFWRVALNNWFGLLPILTAVLPPSFNPNEMYDPTNLVETPFSFPLTVGGFRAMKMGSIRSYNLTGGVSLPVDFGPQMPKHLREELNKIEGLGVSLPYSIFVEGEYRINVLRRSENIAWVGLTTVKRLGHKVSAEVGKVLNLLDKVFLYSWWTGVPVKFFPLEAQMSKSRAWIFDQLYEFDLRESEAREAYKAAVRGDFTVGWDHFKKTSEGGEDTGVRFHFTRDEDVIEGERRTGPNMILFSSQIQNKRSKSEIKITDEGGVFYVLRGKQQLDEEFSDVLTGRKLERYRGSVDMNVDRVPDPDEKHDFIYEFASDDDDPTEVLLSMRIIDRYVNSHEYRFYMDRIRRFTQLPLKSVPKIPRRSEEKIIERRKHMVMSDPTQSHLSLHVTPTYLGRFSATAAVRFSTSALEHVIHQGDDDLWGAFASAFGRDPSEWNDRKKRDSFTSKLNWLKFGLSLPLEIVNVRKASWDFIHEASRAVSAINEIARVATPLEKLEAFYRLFDTNYPEQLTLAMLKVSDLNEVPRSVSFHTKGTGSSGKKIKRMYKSLRNKVYRSVKKFPPTERSRVPDEKLGAFYPGDLRERRKRPAILKLEFDTRSLPDHILEQVSEEPEKFQDIPLAELYQKHLHMRVWINNMPPDQDGRFYFKIEQARQLQLGNFVLAEQVIKLKPRTPELGEAVGTLMYETYISGPLSPFSGPFYDNAMNVGGNFNLTVSSSIDTRVWSDERSLRFGFDDGRLLPP